MTHSVPCPHSPMPSLTSHCVSHSPVHNAAAYPVHYEPFVSSLQKEANLMPKRAGKVARMPTHLYPAHWQRHRLPSHRPLDLISHRTLWILQAPIQPRSRWLVEASRHPREIIWTPFSQRHSHSQVRRKLNHRPSACPLKDLSKAVARLRATSISFFHSSSRGRLLLDELAEEGAGSKAGKAPAGMVHG